MQIYVLLFLMFCAGLAAALFYANYAGKKKAEKKQSDANVKVMDDYEKIDSMPNVDDPLDRMRK